ncbi:MAG: hypothetical protein ABI645_07355, partial [Pseudomonadota bacterium]
MASFRGGSDYSYPSSGLLGEYTRQALIENRADSFAARSVVDSTALVPHPLHPMAILAHVIAADAG